MSFVTQLVAALEDKRSEHLKDVEHMRRLLFIAEHGDTAEECGKVLLDVCDGDIEEARKYAVALCRITENILAGWLMSARLDQLETRGESNGTQENGSAG